VTPLQFIEQIKFIPGISCVFEHEHANGSVLFFIYLNDRNDPRVLIPILRSIDRKYGGETEEHIDLWSIDLNYNEIDYKSPYSPFGISFTLRYVGILFDKHSDALINRIREYFNLYIREFILRETVFDENAKSNRYRQSC
jgi:hypothetical protein